MCGKEDESIDHVFFACDKTVVIWQEVLKWLGVTHQPQPWCNEMSWIIERTKGKGWRGVIMKMAITETVHEVWLYRNSIVFGKDTNRDGIVKRITDCIGYRGWRNRKLRVPLAHLIF